MHHTIGDQLIWRVLSVSLMVLLFGCEETNDPLESSNIVSTPIKDRPDPSLDMSAEDMSAEDMSAEDMSSNDMGSNDMGSNDMGSNDMSSNDMGSNDMGSNDMGSNDMGSNDMGSNDMGSNDMGSNDMGSNDMGSNDMGSSDLDRDTIPDSIDNCPNVANQDQADQDLNGIGDLCEPPVVEISLSISGDFRGETSLEVTPPYARRFSSQVCSVNQSQEFCLISQNGARLQSLSLSDLSTGVYLISAVVADQVEDGSLDLEVQCGDRLVSERISLSDNETDQSAWDVLSFTYPSCEFTIHNELNRIYERQNDSCPNCQLSPCDPSLCPSTSSCDPTSGACSRNCHEQSCEELARCDPHSQACLDDHCSSCQSDSDCELGYSCLRDVNQRKSCLLQCERDSDCRLNEQCMAQNLNYGEGLTLSQEHCMDASYGCDVTLCTDDTTCSGEQRCSSQEICVDCLSDESCPAEAPYCGSGQCFECLEDLHCPDLEYCDQNWCAPLPGTDRQISVWTGGSPPECQILSLFDCSADEICSPIRLSFDFECTLPCDENLMCPEGTLCCDMYCHPEADAPLSCQ